MALMDFITSRVLGRPVELYRFIYGPAVGDFYAFTDWELPVTFNGVTYSPIAVRRNSISTSGTLDKSRLSVEFARSNILTELFKSAPPNNPVVLEIRQGDASENEYNLIWSGRLTNFAINGSTTTLSGEPFGSSIKRIGLRRNYQYGCPHVLYGPVCKANKTTSSFDVEVDAVDGGLITLPIAWSGAIAAVKYTGGLVGFTILSGQFIERTILKVLDITSPGGRDLLLSARLPGLAAGDTVKITLGCNHQMDDCLALFTNITNYGGFPWIPTNNPIGSLNNFY